MNQDKLKKLSEDWLNSVPSIRQHITAIKCDIEKNIYSSKTIENLKDEMDTLNYKLNKIINAIGTLEMEEQKIVCYKYFERLGAYEMAEIFSCSVRTIARKVEKAKLSLGCIMFVFEDEFWSEISKDNIS